MEDEKNWSYIRAPALGILPGLLCPHIDCVQSNGILRFHDFDKMMLRHSNETVKVYTCVRLGTLSVLNMRTIITINNLFKCY